MWYTILFTVGIIALAIILLSIKMLVLKNGKFPNTHIGANRHMKEKGIGCALSTDAKDRSKKDLSEIVKPKK